MWNSSSSISYLWTFFLFFWCSLSLSLKPCRKNSSLFSIKFNFFDDWIDFPIISLLFDWNNKYLIRIIHFLREKIEMFIIILWNFVKNVQGYPFRLDLLVFQKYLFNWKTIHKIFLICLSILVEIYTRTKIKLDFVGAFKEKKCEPIIAGCNKRGLNCSIICKRYKRCYKIGVGCNSICSWAQALFTIDTRADSRCCEMELNELHQGWNHMDRLRMKVGWSKDDINISFLRKRNGKYWFFLLILVNLQAFFKKNDFLGWTFFFVLRKVSHY